MEVTKDFQHDGDVKQDQVMEQGDFGFDDEWDAFEAGKDVKVRVLHFLFSANLK